MPSLTRIGATCLVASLAVLVAGAPAAAAPKRITGKLSKPGYTLIALAANGEATSVRARRGRFRLRPPARRVTLHLRARNGRYAGPVVAGSRLKGRRAILGVRAGAKLGRIKLRRGYAKVSKRPRKSWVDARHKARARKGVPIGAGRFGRVRSRIPRRGVPGDLDVDGVPDVLDIDDDGDLVLDSLDRSVAQRSARAAGAAQGPNEIFDVLTGIDLELERTANANATAVTQPQIDAALSASGRLLLEILPGDSAELDCGGANQPAPRPEGLVYCSKGGTGKVFQGGVLPADWPRFPECCDPDGDGFGALAGSAPPGGTTPFMFLSHGATTAQIATGDVLVERVTRGGVESQFPTALQFVFATVPALARYRDTAGNSAIVSYPVAAGGVGTQGNGFPVAAGAGGDVIVTLTFWRSQRRPILPETGDWIDIGGLTYSTIVQNIAPTPGVPGPLIAKPCPQSAYSTSDPQLTPAGTGFTDLATDRPASPANTFTYTLNLTQCLTSLGASWLSGQEANILIAAVVPPPGAAGAQQGVWFKLQ